MWGFVWEIDLEVKLIPTCTMTHPDSRKPPADSSSPRSGATTGPAGRERLRHPVNFVYREVRRHWLDVAEAAVCPSIDELAPRIRFGREIWIIQAFIMMRDRGYRVSLSDTLRTGAINVVHAADLNILRAPWHHFVVSVRADRDPAFITQTEIVQNRTSVWSENDIYIPHWPQPGLVRRRAERRGRIERLVYMGHAWNLAPAFRDDVFRRALRQIGVELEIREHNWWDYQECDVVLAVRDGAPMYLATKPTSKLVNAWLAGCPAILGPEAGFEELRKGPLDYFLSTGPSDVIAALRALMDTPDLEAAMVANGLERTQEFTRDAVADCWDEALSGPICERFEKWSHSKRSHARRKLGYALGRARRRLWGYQTVQRRPSEFHARVKRLRRLLTLPPASDIG